MPDTSQRGKECIPTIPTQKAPPYCYDPDLAAGIIFTVVSFLSMLAHMVQVATSCKWWYSAFALGAFGQIRRRYSLISARKYLAFFISFDVVSIVIQAVGGASPSKAGAEDSYIPK
ncbi:MAG: hypothetical protein Q9175_001532 [Cornicularia normoerica]